jgi:hypothetical protein
VAAGETHPTTSDPRFYSPTQPRASTAMPTVARLPRILDSVAKDVRSRGLVGEEPPRTRWRP